MVHQLITQQCPEPKVLATPTLKAALPTSCKSPPPSQVPPVDPPLSSDPSSPPPSPVPPVAPPPSSASCYSSSDEISAVHVWKEKQEDLLVHLRHERQDLFEKNRNHGTLWNQIARDLTNTFHIKITPTQALNKYNNLKKRWKEIIDSGTGTERKYFRLKEEFDLMYGTKQSSKPSFTMDSITDCSTPSESSEIPLTEQTTARNLQSPKKSPMKKLKKCAKKRKHELEILEAREKEFNDKIEKFHAEKMQRMDRFLDLFEKSIKNKE